MTVGVIRKWGNSLALRLPRELAAALNLREDNEVKIERDDGRLIITPCPAPEYSLDELLAGCKPRHFKRTPEDSQWLNDAPKGREAL